MKPVRLLCHMFLLAFLDLIVYNVQKHSQHFELTNQKKYRINLFSRNLGPKIKKIVYSQGASNINYSTVVFNFAVYLIS